MIDAVDELIAYRKLSGRLSPMLRRVRRFHRANPQVLDFLFRRCVWTVKTDGAAHR